MSNSCSVPPFSLDGWAAIINRKDFLIKSLEAERPGSPEYISNSKELVLVTQVLDLRDIITNNDQQILELKGLSSEGLGDLVEEEIAMKQSESADAIKAINAIVFPPDKENNCSVFLEIRAGTGGLEASLFAAELMRMYTLYSQKKQWRVSCVDSAETEVGGIREVILHIEGKNVYELLRYESGVHRVQRVPNTETQGRVHTSTATVAVLPEIDEVSMEIEPKDLRIDTYRASGAGGQHVNKTDSAVRITHFPTGLVVSCQEERSQHKNKAKAMKVLQSRIYALEKEKRENEVSQMRKKMVASAERSDKIRTYNFPQNRVTDHRIGLTINRLEYIVNEGELEELVIALNQNMLESRSVHPLLEQYLSQ